MLQRIAEGDEHAFRQLFEQYADTVYSAAYLLLRSSDLAEDIVQEVFTRIWIKRTQLQTVDKIDAWLFIIARNLIYGRMRKEALADKYRQYIKNYFSEGPKPRTGDRVQGTRQQYPAGHPASAPQCQKAFRLSRYKGLSHEEIAREMGVSRDTVKSYIVQSIASLRKAFVHNSSYLLIFLGLEYFS